MLTVFTNVDDLHIAAADFFVAKAKEAIETKNKFTVALTGGSSPTVMYNLLATTHKNKVDWSKVFVFWGDERWVPIEDDKSNAGHAFKDFLNAVDVPENQIFPMWKDGVSAEAYAKTYEALLEEHLVDGEVFDLILLGMGDDGHTASLFPNQPVLAIDDKKVDAYFLAPQDMYRITLTKTAINKAKDINFIVFGDKKADALYEVLEGEQNTELYPSQLIKPVHGTINWFVDAAAAKKLSAS